jgi:hypothetical protein
MNVAALLPMRAMPETGHFGWDWFSDGRRWKIKAFSSPCETRPARHPEDNPSRHRQAMSIDARTRNRAGKSIAPAAGGKAAGAWSRPAKRREPF